MEDQLKYCLNMSSNAMFNLVEMSLERWVISSLLSKGTREPLKSSNASTSRTFAILAKISALGYLAPRSMLLKKIMDISAFSAKTAWVKFRI